MAEQVEQRMHLDCQECTFSTLAAIDGERLPAEILIEHSRETGHKVALSQADHREEVSEGW